MTIIINVYLMTNVYRINLLLWAPNDSSAGHNLFDDSSVGCNLLLWWLQCGTQSITLMTPVRDTIYNSDDFSAGHNLFDDSSAGHNLLLWWLQCGTQSITLMTPVQDAIYYSDDSSAGRNLLLWWLQCGTQPITLMTALRDTIYYPDLQMTPVWERICRKPSFVSCIFQSGPVFGVAKTWVPTPFSMTSWPLSKSLARTPPEWSVIDPHFAVRCKSQTVWSGIWLQRWLAPRCFSLLKVLTGKSNSGLKLKYIYII
jgi:hypothetical protein